ncbi:MFS transporter [Streptomyces rimosus subsp. rimosus]|nr:MFS transporter [Streptomyces sp. NRRL WC-3701]KOT33121.1 MFS transporter [Streptomyces rimosus subsp. rimosus]KOT57560.1 MFS transporter [Streptomyces rimosus subsp. rimosus]KOT58685.1 MFS transporter [Streptomyces rimosus subsp. rimosus]KOT81439.1 MFS transporter [Streptomyces rimosus subsp. rimosus]
MLLAGAAASQAGTQVALVALPLVAVVGLRASAFEVGLLTAAETAAFLLIGLPAGAWVDRVRRLPLLIRTDVVRAVAMGSVPLAALCHVLTMAQLYVVAFVTGVATVFFDVAHQSYLPRVLPGPQLVAGNGALETARSAAQVAGPGLGGGIVQLLGPPVAVLANAAGYLASALFLRGIRVREPEPEAAAGGSLGAQVKEGLAFVLRHPVLRVIALTTGVANFFSAMLVAVQTVFLTRELGLPPGVLGLMLSASAVGGLAGALCAGPVARRLGQARIIWLAPVVTGPFALLWPLSGQGAAAGWFALGSGAVFFGAVVYNVAQVSFRQLLCPDALLGRMNATLRFMVWGTMPLGALAGGAVAEAAGSRAAVWVCAAGFLLVPVPLLLSPLRKLRDLPAGTGPAAADETASGPVPEAADAPGAAV